MSNAVFIAVIQLILLVTFLWLMLRKQDLGWSTKDRLDEVPQKRDMIQIAMQQQQQSELSRIAAWFEEADGAARSKYINEKLFRAIDYNVRRHDWYEDQRSRMFQGVIAIVSALLVVAGIVLRVEPSPSTPVLIVAFGSALVAIFAVALVVSDYNAELDRDRPYRMVSDIRFWYFRYNLSTASSRNAESDPIAVAREILAQRDSYLERLKGNASLVTGTREDIEQLFILQILQRQKSESLTTMRHRLSWTAAFFALQVMLFVAAFGLMACWPTQ